MGLLVCTSRFMLPSLALKFALNLARPAGPTVTADPTACPAEGPVLNSCLPAPPGHPSPRTS